MPTFTEQTARDFWASLDEKSKLALAKTAPEILTSWEGDESWYQRDCWDSDAQGIGCVFCVGDGSWATTIERVPWDYFPDADAAKSAVDARLREMGFVLEEES